VILYLLGPLVYLPDADDYFGAGTPEDVRHQLEHFYWVWDDPARAEAAHAKLREVNPEWDLISRTFLGYSLANIALKDATQRERALRRLDLVIHETVHVPWREFLLGSGHERPFVRAPARSVMVDGEVSLMIGLRRLVQDAPNYVYRQKRRELVRNCIEAIEANPMLVAECYPDECWLWCNPLALRSVKVFDILENEDHSDLFERWPKTARDNFTAPLSTARTP